MNNGKSKNVGNFKLTEGKTTISVNGEIKENVPFVHVAETERSFLDWDISLYEHTLDDFPAEEDVKSAIRKEDCEAIHHIKIFDWEWEDTDVARDTQNDLLQEGLLYVEDLLEVNPERDLYFLNTEKTKALATALHKSRTVLNPNWKAFVDKYCDC